jgi:ketosteroid isomerase-like protein
MTRIIIDEDCGNSPKNIFVQDFTIALAKGDSKFILNHITDDVRWEVVGDKVMQGKDRFAEALEERKNDQALELTIHHVATHGKAGAVNGRMKFKNKRTHAFSNVYEFSNTKGTSIKGITSYVIEIR